MSPAEVTYEELLEILKKDFSEKTANEILIRIDKLGREGRDIENVEKKVTEYIVHNIQRDLDKVIKSLSGPPIMLPKIPLVASPDAPKNKK